MSSNSSASSRFARCRRPPLPYSENPLEYEPAVFCSCGAKAARLTSWTDANPGRRYMSCSRATGCPLPHWRWLDPKPSAYMRELLVGLRDRIRVLEEDNDVLSSPAFRGNVSDQHHDRRWGCRLGAALVLVLLFALAGFASRLPVV
ncbi:hypothetical protein VPH35_066780 [Triticum aestivum]|uniref:uncharacterized protein n=1 Tax=Triticum aestivum TaxID=4565 RepID=UPI001D006C7E|nr:uncharacterized protein LOC123082198 [Triticum aestivum]